MKPIKLTIYGINSFSERVTIDFRDFGEGLFCISGKTGSGKTTVLDSILIALYGDTKRRGKVSDYINMGMEKAEVELEFEANGSNYRVNRVIDFKGTKASLVRLDDNALISDQVSVVNSSIASLMGMDLATFTQVVILQQGEFDKFLHATPSARRDTVGKLFRLSRYEKLYNRFNGYYETLNSEINTLESAAENYRHADERSVTQLEGEIAELKKESELSQKKLAEISKRKTELEVIKKLYDESEARRAEASKLTLEGLELQKTLESLNREKSEYGQKNDLEKLRQDEKDAMLELQRLKNIKPSLKLFSEKKSELEKIRAAYKTLSAELKKEREKSEIVYKHREEVASVLKQTVATFTSGYSSDKYYKREGFSELKTFLGGLKLDVARAEGIKKNIDETNAEKEEAMKKRGEAANAFREIMVRENDIRTQLTRAEETLENHKKELNDLRSVKALSSVIRELKIGDNCPVCGNRITFLKTADDGDFTQAEEDIAQAEAKVKELTEALSKVKQESATVREADSSCEERISRCTAKLKELQESVKLTPKVSLKTLENAEKCCEMLDKTDSDIVESDHKVEIKSKELANLNERGQTVRADLDRLADTMGQTDVEADIDTLIASAEERAAFLASEIKNTEKNTQTLATKITDTEKQIEANRAALEKVNEQLSQRIDYDAAEYLLTNQRYAEADKRQSELNTSLAQKNAQLDTAKRDAAMLKNITDRKNKLVKDADRAAKLAKLVKGEVFLDFVAREYVESFTQAASEIMQELSSGQYCLELGERSEFMIRDFFRNNTLRSVSTLSGGETFLASLSMAVAISRELSQYTGNGFFFLDEGFGTLDNDYINAVYESLDKLSRDTMVGLVTHCTELIELVGNGIEIEKPDSSTGSKILRK